MAVLRDEPYGRFNFLVDIGDDDAGSVQAGFMEVTGLDVALDVIEYRNGNERRNAPRLLPGLYRAARVVLKRGVIGALNLQQWFDQAKTGSREARRRVVIHLLTEMREETAQTWILVNAFPVSMKGPRLSAITSDIAIEELTLAAEDIVVE